MLNTHRVICLGCFSYPTIITGHLSNFYRSRTERNNMSAFHAISAFSPSDTKQCPLNPDVFYILQHLVKAYREYCILTHSLFGS
jgi:hypothetical protein